MVHVRNQKCTFRESRSYVTRVFVECFPEHATSSSGGTLAREQLGLSEVPRNTTFSFLYRWRTGGLFSSLSFAFSVHIGCPAPSCWDLMVRILGIL